MKLELDGKVALVTGSSRGIGRVIAEKLHAQGCKVVINGRNKRDLEIVASDLLGSVIAKGDVSQPQGAQQVVEKGLEACGKINILICNVGNGRSVTPGEETWEEWQRVFALNLWATTNMVEAACNALAKNKGNIVCVSSICGNEVVLGAPVTYSVAKAALNAYVRGIARPLGKQGVRINAVAPGNIMFDGSVWSQRMAEDASSVKAMLERNVALAKLGTPGDVAGLVAYLASPQAGFATGGVWTLDGGQAHS
jgi:3-oxoacyl-[acyl-carrier protein] reductase